MSLSRCCRLFGLSRQSIYQSEARSAQREKQLAAIAPLVTELRMEMPRLGTRKMYYLLKERFEDMGVKIGRDAFFDYLRREQLLIKPRKLYVRTTDSKHWMRKHPNLLTNTQAKAPEEVFVSDITYVKSRQGTHYLSLVTDAYSRKIMGYRLADDMRAETVKDALTMAINNKVSNKATIHHSDRGVQYCSDVYQKELASAGMKPSMTDGYDCYQNALAERINGILKGEFLIDKSPSIDELQKMVTQSIDIYNEKRPHLNLGMKTPNFVHDKVPQN